MDSALGKKLQKFAKWEVGGLNEDQKTKPHPFQETKNPDTIKLLIRVQRQFLVVVAKSKNDDPDFVRLLHMLEDLDVDTREREKAEHLVHEAVLSFGEWVGHGDLLTVKMIQEGRMLMAGSATAFGRLEFLGPFRLQLLHMKMKKVCQVQFRLRY